MYLEDSTQQIPVKLPNGSIVRVEISGSGRQDVSLKTFNFEDIADILEGITCAIRDTVSKAKPQKATVKFGLEMGLESGQLTAAIVKGSGKANLEVTLEWNEQR